MQTIAIITRRSQSKKTGKFTKKEIVPYISSLINPSPELFLSITRAHWTIENSLHYVKDVTFGEDKNTMHSGFGPLNMTILRSFAISLARLLNFDIYPDAAYAFKQNFTRVLKSLNTNKRL